MAGDRESDSDNGLPIDIPAQTVDSVLKAAFRRDFNRKVFGIVDDEIGQSSSTDLVMSPTQLTKSIQMTQQRWNSILEMIEQWGSADAANK
jgi:hypothetical protein